MFYLARDLLSTIRHGRTLTVYPRVITTLPLSSPRRRGSTPTSQSAWIPGQARDDKKGEKCLLEHLCTHVLALSLLIGLSFMIPTSYAQDFADDPFEYDYDVGVVGRRTFDPKGKFDITLYGGLNAFNVLISDAMLGGGVRYNLMNWLGIEGRYIYHFFSMTDTALRAESSALASAISSFYIDFIQSEMLAHVVLSPFYGKHHVWGTTFVNYQLYAFVGGGILTLDQVVILASPNTSSWGISFGAGFKFYLNNFLSLTLEARDLVYSDNSFDDSQMSAQFAVTLGLGITLPTFEMPQRKI